MISVVSFQYHEWMIALTALAADGRVAQLLVLEMIQMTINGQ
jgi:hypothetical protein